MPPGGAMVAKPVCEAGATTASGESNRIRGSSAANADGYERQHMANAS